MTGRNGRRFRYYAGAVAGTAVLLVLGFVAREFQTARRSSVLLLRQAAVAIEAKNLPLATRLLDAILEREPANRKALLYRGEVARDSGDSVAAVKIWSMIPDSFPQEAAVARQFE